MKKLLDRNVVIQLLNQEYGVRTQEFTTTFRDAAQTFAKSILPENQEKSIVLVLAQEDDSGEMKFSTNALLTVAHFIKIVEDQADV